MRVSEIFKSIDGEGKRAGLPTIFIRFVGCPLRCKWCDSLYAVEPKENDYTDMSVDEILKKVKEFGLKSITVTGGEPLIQKDIGKLFHRLSNHGYDVNVETCGAIDIENYNIENIWFTVDYKCPSSGMENKMLSKLFDSRTPLIKTDVLKFVIGSKEDLEKAAKVAKEFHKYSDAQIYFSPVFNTISYEDIVSYILDNNLTYVKFQLQLHKFVWDCNKRGV